MNHDDKGRVQSLTDDFENPYLSGMTKNLAGQVTELTLGTGVVENYGYHSNRLRLTTQTATKSGNQLMNLSYSYQATAGQMGQGSTAGNAGQLMGITGTINSTTENAGYTYDLLGRLVTSTQGSNGASADRQFVYDRWGNRTEVYEGLPGGKNPPTLIQCITLQQSGGAPTNRITSVTEGSTVNYTYDAAGNVTNDGAHSYKYDAENRIVKVDDGATAEYKYDHQKRRVTKVVGSSWTHYVWEGAQVIGEHDATTPFPGYGEPTYQEQSARLDYVYAGAKMIRSRQRSSSTGPWTTRYFLSDRLSVRLTLDSSGNVLGRQAHLPFGEHFGESGTQEKHRFTSYERDTESGMDYAINRGNSPEVGRFLQADPYRASGYMVDPQSWNRYSYVQNNPIGFVDHLGLLRLNTTELCDGSMLGAIFCDPIRLIALGTLSSPFPSNTDAEPEEETKPPRNYAGFSSGDVTRIEEAIDLGLSLLDGTASDVNIDNECTGNLIATPTPINGKTVNLAELYRILRLWRNKIKPKEADETEVGPYYIINGADSVANEIVTWRRANPRAGASPFGAGVMIFGPFFGGSHRAGLLGFPRSRAVALIHEALHIQGISDLDFDRKRERGSRDLNTFIVKSCVDKNKSHEHLNFTSH